MRFCLDDFGPFIFASTQPNEQIDYSRFFFFSWFLFCHWFFGQPVLGSAPGRASRAASRTRPPSTKTPPTPKAFGYETDSNSGQTNASSDAYLCCDSDSRRDTCTFRNQDHSDCYSNPDFDGQTDPHSNSNAKPCYEIRHNCQGLVIGVLAFEHPLFPGELRA
jgi:hypothetical protein